jgi:hypothetical protein
VKENHQPAQGGLGFDACQFFMYPVAQLAAEVPVTSSAPRALEPTVRWFSRYGWQGTVWPQSFD